MPLYNLICKKRHIEERPLTFHDYDVRAFGFCSRCSLPLSPVAANKICVYGTVKYHDKALRDASEAAGRKISSAREADQCEKNGEMYRITNPSQYRRKRRDNNKAWREKLARAL